MVKYTNVAFNFVDYTSCLSFVLDLYKHLPLKFRHITKTLINNPENANEFNVKN